MITIELPRPRVHKKHAPTISVDELPCMYRIVRVLKAPASLKDTFAIEAIAVEDDGPHTEPKYMLVSVPVGSTPLMKKGSWLYLVKIQFGDCLVYQARR